MLIPEALFLSLLALAIGRLVIGPRFGWLTYPRLAMAGTLLLLACLVTNAWRWQLLPAVLAFVLLMLGSLKRRDTRAAWRLVGAIPLLVLTGISAVLAQLMPVVTLPAPAGPYGVGTFDFSITDDARLERYAPGRHRELYVEVWYPADTDSLEAHPVSTLFHQLHEGEFSRTNVIFGYLKDVQTHSHIHAAVAASPDGKFPVLLFNHALGFGFTSQNLLLMEHLASHGYVVASIAHPYQTAKVNLANAGTILRTDRSPEDIELPQAALPRGIVGAVFEGTGDIHQVSSLKQVLSPLAEEFLALDATGKGVFVDQVAWSPGFEPFRSYLSDGMLQDFFYYDYQRENSLTEYWVQDIQFILESLPEIQAPVEGFREAIDLDRLAVAGVSYGGSAAGEFCKIDTRCKAGVNLDGTQFGRHWDRKLPVPFLMLYNEEHQGGNDFAYLPPLAEFHDLRVQGAMHIDFTDFVYLWPVMKLAGISGSIEGMRMMQILDAVLLEFLDHYLKGLPAPDGIGAGFPEIGARR